MPIKDLTGKRFHSLVAINICGEDIFHRKIWLCKCDCGKKKEIRGRSLVSGQIVTCGCGIGRQLPKPYLGMKRDKHPRWKGGEYVSCDGYVMLYAGNGKYRLKHRVVYENKYGPIPSDCIIHHKNEIKTDNRLSNLELMKKSQHAIHHDLGAKGVRSNLKLKHRNKKNDPAI